MSDAKNVFPKHIERIRLSFSVAVRGMPAQTNPSTSACNSAQSDVLSQRIDWILTWQRESISRHNIFFTLPLYNKTLTTRCDIDTQYKNIVRLSNCIFLRIDEKNATQIRDKHLNQSSASL